MVSRQLLRQLKDILGSDGLLSDPADLVGYAGDAAGGLPEVLPDVVVLPTQTEQISRILTLASAHRVPVYPRGAGTNLSGGVVPLEGGIVLCTVRMDRIRRLDPVDMYAVVEPGVVIEDLNRRAGEHGLLYPPDPGSVATATMGGSVAEGSGGLRGLKYGVTRDYVLGLEVVLADGRVVRVGGRTIKNVTGYDLVRLFVGSEGTLGVITEITVRLIPAPEASATFLATFDDLGRAGRAVADIVGAGVLPATLEIMDDYTLACVEEHAALGLPTDAAALLLIEVDGPRETVEIEAATVEEVCARAGARSVQRARDRAERDRLWAARRAALPALARRRPVTILEDITVPRSKVAEMLTFIREIAARYGLEIGTFGHAGDGNLHPTILVDEIDDRVEAAVRALVGRALALGGTLSGEHGIGMAKAPFLVEELGREGVALTSTIKRALDPLNILNPGKFPGRWRG